MIGKKRNNLKRFIHAINTFFRQEYSLICLICNKIEQMARVLTGIQSSGRPHLGNILGAIVPAINLIEQNSKEESFIFIADLHSLTTQKDGGIRKENTLAVAAAWLAFGLDITKTVFYRQSRIPEVTELTWYLNCFTPFPMLAHAHSFNNGLRTNFPRRQNDGSHCSSQDDSPVIHCPTL
jgi:tryptophanyl-tRNA synthetase